MTATSVGPMNAPDGQEPAPQSGTNAESDEIERFRIEKAYRLSLIGLSVIVLLTIVLAGLSMFGFDKAGEVSQVVSPFLAILGTLVGAFFGVQVGSAGREDAVRQAEEANRRAAAFAAGMSPDSIPDVEAAFGVLER